MHVASAVGYRSRVSNDASEGLGRLDDDAEEQAPSDDTPDGPAARGEYDPTEGSPDHQQPVAEDLAEERSDHDEDQRPATDA